MPGLLTTAQPLLIFGVRDRYLVAVAVLAVVVAVLLLVIRRRRPRLDIHRLDATDARRYAASFEAVEADFQAQPQVAIGRARGMVDEVMRRMGFPDRVDAAQRGKDLAGHDRRAAQAYESAGRDLRAADSAALGRAMAAYREVLDRLLSPATKA